MFTGLVQAVGRVRAMSAMGGDVRLRIAGGGFDYPGLSLGESVAVSGVCLTVVARDAEGFDADVSNETLGLTSLAVLREGSAVNLERALTLADRLGGHLVSGHVDGLGRLLSKQDDGRSERWRIAAPAGLMKYIAAKGSICVDGVSLTVNAVDAEAFEVNLVPHTLLHTNFSELEPGAPLNLEVDLLARYVERLLSVTGMEIKAS